MNTRSVAAIRTSNLAHQAAACRAQPEHFSAPERDLLLAVAGSFDQVASGDDLRRAIEASRCW